MATGATGLMVAAAPRNVVLEVANYKFVTATVLCRRMEGVLVRDRQR